MTDNTANQVPLFASMNQGSKENNILQYPFLIFQPQAGFVHPFSLMPNIWHPNDDVLRQRMMELGLNVFPFPSSDTTKVSAPRKESVIVTAKPDGGVVPFTLTQELPTSCIAASLQSSFTTKGHQKDDIQSISAEDKSKSSTGEKHAEVLSEKQLLSGSDPQKTSQKFTELDVAQILVNDIPVPFIGKLKDDVCQSTESTNEKTISSDVPHNILIKEGDKCDVCSQVFRSPLGLQKHLEFHSEKVQHHTCTTCFEKFDSIASLEEHRKTHLKKRPHKCSFCPKAFRDPGSLQKHVRVHTGEKPYKCTSCFRSFAEYSSLRKHLRTHTGEQPYKCSFCSKAFSISGNLQRHILIHTGERPYKCTFCPKAFNNPSHLRRHVKNLHYKSEGKGWHLFGGKDLNNDSKTDDDLNDSKDSEVDSPDVRITNNESVTQSDNRSPNSADDFQVSDE